MYVGYKCLILQTIPPGCNTAHALPHTLRTPTLTTSTQLRSTAKQLPTNNFYLSLHNLST